MDIIKHATFQLNRFRGFGAAVGQKWPFSIELAHRPYNSVRTNVLHCDVPNIRLNFHLNWFSTFWYTWTFMFEHFDWNCLFGANFVRFWGLKYIKFLPILTRKSTSLPDSASFEPMCVQVPPWVCSLRWSEKKIVTRKFYFTPLPKSPPRTDFHQIWNKHSSHQNNQSWQIICQSIQGFRFYRDQIFHLSR